MPNDNCLEGMKCPRCGSEEPFNISAKACFKVFDDGTDSFGAVDWDDDSVCECVNCNLRGFVCEFKKCKACTTGDMAGPIAGTLSNGERCDTCDVFATDEEARKAVEAAKEVKEE
jgi:ribosomal protein L37E